jgi:hypothetical protein
MRRKHVYQFFILLTQCVCGGLVVEKDYSFIAEFAAIILPTAIVVAILFIFYDREVIKEFNDK